MWSLTLSSDCSNSYRLSLSYQEWMINCHFDETFLSRQCLGLSFIYTVNYIILVILMALFHFMSMKKLHHSSKWTEAIISIQKRNTSKIWPHFWLQTILILIVTRYIVLHECWVILLRRTKLKITNYAAHFVYVISTSIFQTSGQKKKHKCHLYYWYCTKISGMVCKGKRRMLINILLPFSTIKQKTFWHHFAVVIFQEINWYL